MTECSVSRQCQGMTVPFFFFLNSTVSSPSNLSLFGGGRGRGQHCSVFFFFVVLRVAGIQFVLKL